MSAPQTPGSMSVSDTDLGRKRERTLKHTENRATVFSPAGGIQTEGPLRAALLLDSKLYLPASAHTPLLIKLGFYNISEEEKVILEVKIC